MNSFALLQEEVEDDGATIVVNSFTKAPAILASSTNESFATAPITQVDATQDPSKSNEDKVAQASMEKTLTLDEYNAQKAALSSAMITLKIKNTTRMANDGADGFEKFSKLQMKDQKEVDPEESNMSGVQVKKGENPIKALKDSTHATVARNAEIQKFFQKDPNDPNSSYSRGRGFYRGRGRGGPHRGSNTYMHRSNYHSSQHSNGYTNHFQNSNNMYDRSNSHGGSDKGASYHGNRGNYSNQGHDNRRQNTSHDYTYSVDNANMSYDHANTTGVSNNSADSYHTSPLSKNIFSSVNQVESSEHSDDPASGNTDAVLATIRNGDPNGPVDDADNHSVQNVPNNPFSRKNIFNNPSAYPSGLSTQSGNCVNSDRLYRTRGRGRGRGRGGYDRGGRGGYVRDGGRGRGRGSYRGGYDHNRRLKSNSVDAPNVDDHAAFPSLG